MLVQTCFLFLAIPSVTRLIALAIGNALRGEPKAK